jgi:alkylhydroperoxidase family enzyme
MADDIDELLGYLVGQSSIGTQPEAVTEFADQFAVDVSGITDEQRAALSTALGKATFPVVVRIYLADFLPRVKAGLAALGLPTVWWNSEPETAPDADPSDVLFNSFLPAVARLRDLDPITTELVRLRGARAHDCRMCKSLREGAALDAGGSETLYDDVDSYESSELISESQKAALRFADAMIWTPAHIEPAVADGVLRHFSAAQARELTLDVMRNASNKIAVALNADAPRVEQGTERYLIDADGQTVYS